MDTRIADALGKLSGGDLLIFRILRAALHIHNGRACDKRHIARDVVVDEFREAETIGGVTIEAAWCSVVDTHIGNQANHIALLRCYIEDAAQLVVVDVDTDAGIGGLATRSECSASCSRVGHGVRHRVVGHKVASSELREVQTLDLTLTLLHRKELLGAEDMVETHTIANEVEYILWLLLTNIVAASVEQKADTKTGNGKTQTANCYF